VGVNEEDPALTTLLHISPAGREKLKTIASQAKSTPEKLIGMLLASELPKVDGYAIGAANQPDSSGQVTLTVHRAPHGKPSLLEVKVPFRLGSVGWQLPIPDALIDAIPAALEQGSMYVAPKPVGN
jgi:hypothetical protein